MAMPQRSTCKLTANTQKLAMEKQESKERFPAFPTASTTTNYNYLWDTHSEGKVTCRATFSM
jgi:hypothetical protein